MILRSPHDKHPINWYGVDAWIPYAWDETSATTDWTSFDSSTSKEHYVVPNSTYGIPISSVAVQASLKQSGVASGDGAVIGALYLDGTFAISTTKVRSNNFSIVGVTHDVNDWADGSIHTASFRIKVSGTSKGVQEIYEFYVKGRS